MTEGEIRYLVSLCKSGIRSGSLPERQEAMYALGRLEEFAAQHASPERVVLLPVLPDDRPLCVEHEPDPEADHGGLMLYR